MSERTTATAPQETNQPALELDELGKHAALPLCEDITELGMYSIHESSARTVTVPEDADGFDDVAVVKQYYFEGEHGPLLIIAPLG